MNQLRIKWKTSGHVTQIYSGITVAKWLDCHLTSRRTSACRHGAFSAEITYSPCRPGFLPDSADMKIRATGDPK